MSRIPARQTLAEFRALVGRSPCPDYAEHLVDLPRGAGSTVIVLPAILRGDSATAAVRAGLCRLGWDARGWGLGLNLGPTPVTLAALRDVVAHAAPAHLLGFSMGGLFARYLAVELPGAVRSLVTVCSPYRNPISSAWLPLEPLLPFWGGAAARELAERIARPLTMPTTALYSRRDGIVRWESCFDPASRAIELDVPHCTIMHDAAVFRVVARILADQDAD